MLGVAKHFESSGTRLKTDAETRDLRVVRPGLGLGDEGRGVCRLDGKEESRDDPGVHSGTGLELRLELRSRTQLKLDCESGSETNAELGIYCEDGPADGLRVGVSQGCGDELCHG